MGLSLSLIHILENEGLSSKEMNVVLNKKSGLLGVSGVSSDMRDVTAAMKEGNSRAKLAPVSYTHLSRWREE